jgi:hypothetical protein
MSMALELLIFIGIFAVGLGLIGTFMGSEDAEKRRLRAEHEARRYAKQPWDRDREDRIRPVVHTGHTPVG